MRQTLATLACLFLLACASDPASEPATAPQAEPVRVPKPDLTDACQLRACVCVQSDVPFFVEAEKRDATWSSTGEISCPEGFELRREDQL